VYTLVERALNDLLNCTKINVNDDIMNKNQYMGQKGYRKTSYGYDSYEVTDIVKTKPIPKLEPSMVISNHSFL
jgi:hypothetical protein